MGRSRSSKRIPAQVEVERAIAALRSGQVVAIPTDTVYGLAASFDHPDAIERLYEIKGRETTKAIPVLVDTHERLFDFQRVDREVSVVLAREFWPGPLTLVVWASNLVPEVVHRGAGTVGLRMPDHPVARGLIAGLGGALAVTSANHSGQAEAMTAEEVRESLGSAVDVVIDGGRTPGGRASTVVDLTRTEIRILRQGEITIDEIERVIHDSSVEE
ncbi:hypothetical protein BH20CHL1_BH20CHL1_05020 [soil metagenome]